VSLGLLAAAAQAETLSVLHTFSGGRDGATPYAGLTMDRAGNLYGTASAGGAGHGTVFKLAHGGSGWTFSPLYSFQGTFSQDGAVPLAALTLGPDGSLYGTTELGGADACTPQMGCGTVFNLKPPPTRPVSAFSSWDETVLYRFTPSYPYLDGVYPYGEVVFDAAGNIYGTDSEGGLGGGSHDCDPGGPCGPCDPYCGTVFQMTRSGNSWTESVIHNFTALATGAYPESGLVVDPAGNLYGTTSMGGDCGVGTVFEMTPPGSGWTLNTIGGFCAFNDGGTPYGTPLLDSSGNLYGGTLGVRPGYGTALPGSAFSLTASDGGWNFNLLYTFSPDGQGVAGSLSMDAAGNLYGTTIGGGMLGGACGATGCGTVFKLQPSEGGWTYSDLYKFTGGNDGSTPYSRVVFDPSGNLYGTTSAGGANGLGTVWELTP